MITVLEKRAITAAPEEDSKANYQQYFKEVVKLVNNLEGSLVECGFGKGKTANIFTDFMLDGTIQKRTMYLYDSFEGFPAPSKEDESKRNPQKGEWAVPIEEANKVKEKANVPVEVVKGYFEDTIKDYNGGPIAVLHIDCDLYQSYKTVLETLYDKVVTGGLIMFDEYGEGKKWPGGVQAINEFFEDKNVEFFRYQFPEFGKFCMIKP
jgi:hypothetical protein